MKLTLQQYADFCEGCDVSAALAPAFVEYYFAQLGVKPKLVGVRGNDGQLIAAFPSLYRMVFPTALHKKLLGKSFARLGDVGQPESLFPVLPGTQRIALNHLSPMTSSLLASRIRAPVKRSLRSVAIAKERKHKKLSVRARAFVAEGGEVHYAADLPPAQFADTYLDLHCRRWGYDVADLAPVRAQILALYPHVHGVLLVDKGVPVAAQWCFQHIGPTTYYVDFINSGVQREEDDNTVSYGSVMMLMNLRRAEENAKALGKTLRYSFGFQYGTRGYKAVWADPDPTFIGL